MPDDFLQPSRIFHPFPREDDVNAASAIALSDEDRAPMFVGVVEKLVGREHTPRAIGVAPGTIENIRRLRRKTMPSSLYRKIREAVIRVCEERIRYLDATICLARQGGESTGDDKLLAAATALAELQAVIKEAAK